MQHQQRQLAAILFTDIVGYTAMMQQDENRALAVVKWYIETLQKSVGDHGGRLLNDYGDGSLCTFSSATQAIQCAVEIQKELQKNVPTVPLRIGLHIGEIFFEGEKVLGDGVNVASRIQSLGQANSILFSKEIHDKIKNKPEFRSISLGSFEFKNVDDPMEIFALTNEGLIVPKKELMSGKLKEITKKSNQKKFVSLALLMVTLAGVFFFYKNYLQKPAFIKGEKSIAILPFEIIGNNGDNLASGLVEDILIHLSKIQRI